MPALVRLLLLSLVLALPASAAGGSWGGLKIGMSPRQIAALLGTPLMRTQGHGYETWIYDQGAEVLLHGGLAVIGWTAPASAGIATRCLDIWNDRAAGETYASLCAARAAENARRRAVGRPPLPAAGGVYEDYLGR